MRTIEGRSKRRKRAVRAAACLALAALAAPPLVRDCGYHDPSSVSLGMLNWAFPDALHVRTAVWIAQREGTLARPDDAEAFEAGTPQYVLRQLHRFRQTGAQLSVLHKALASRDGQALPPFSVVLVGSMMWTRFATIDGVLAMAVHTDGPATGDVVIVTDAPVVDAIAAGRLAPRNARHTGLLRIYGEPRSVESIAAVLDGLDTPNDAGAAGG